MKINEIITHLVKEGTWVNWDKTRDVVLFGETDKEITNVGVCWILTDKAIDQAIKHNINFVVTHENCFYFESTHQYRLLLESRIRKQERLKQHDITVYRSHDVWDYVAGVGNLDSFKNALQLDFQPRSVNEKYSVAYFDKRPVKELAQRVAKALSVFGQSHAEVLGDPLTMVGSLAIGIGAACNVFDMLKYPNVDCILVSDDGACNWVEHQYCLDNNIALIIVHHSINEILGMNSMAAYLQKAFPKLDISYLDEGFEYHVVNDNDK